MKVFDPLVWVERSGAQADLAGWAVAAAIIARLHEFGLSDGIDVKAILDPVTSDLSEAELEKLARQINGPLLDTPRYLLRAWQDKDQNAKHTSRHTDPAPDRFKNFGGD
jgi:hypothetical protein